jgi:hypothetical protein
VPDQKSPLGNSFGIGGQVPHLAVHLFENPLEYLRIIRCIGELFRTVPVQIFRIGHVDIDDPFQELNHFDGLISGAVVDNRKPEAQLYGFREGGNDLRGIMGRGDEVNVMATHFLEPDHDSRHIWGGHGFTVSKMADVVILTENAPKVAVSEKNGP